VCREHQYGAAGQIDGCANCTATAAGFLILKTIRYRATAPTSPSERTDGPDKMFAEVKIDGIGSGTGTSAYPLVLE